MKRIYVAILCFWLAVGFGVSAYYRLFTTDNQPRELSQFQKEFTLESLPYGKPRYSSMAIYTTIVGALVIVGVGVIDRPKKV